MAKKSALPNIGSLIGSIKPYGDTEAENGKPAMIALESIRLDAAQPRRLLPADLAQQVHLGQLGLVQAMRQWAATAGMPLTIEPVADDALAPSATRNWSSHRLYKVRELAASIAHLGLIHPVNVVPQEDGSNVVETGERRVLALAWLVACGQSEYQTLPALFVSQSANHRSRQVVENLSREDLSAVEKARGLWNIRYEMSGMGSPAWDQLAGDATLSDTLEKPGLVPWAEVQRQFGISKRYRIWLTQTMELCPEAIAVIEQHGLPERATRPLVQWLRDDPEGQMKVLQSLLADDALHAAEASAAEVAATEASTPNWSADYVEIKVKQYLAGREKAGRTSSTAPVAEPAPAEAGSATTRVILAAKRAMRSLDRAMGARSPGKKALTQIAGELSADDETVRIARQIKPLVDALAAAPGGSRKMIRERATQPKKGRGDK